MDLQSYIKRPLISKKNKNEWVKILEDTEIVVDELLEKQKASDPDLWVVEVESANGQNYLDEFY